MMTQPDLKQEQSLPTKRPLTELEIKIHDPTLVNYDGSQNLDHQYEGLDKQLQELQIKCKPENAQEDRRELEYILNNLFYYPSMDLAEIHQNSNKLGSLDLQEKEGKKAEIFNDGSVSQVKICACCGFVYQEQELRICSTSLEDINNIGESTYSFFRTILNVIFLLCAMTLIYSVYAFTTNLTSSKNLISDAATKTNQSNLLNYLSISLASKYLTANGNGGELFLISCWLGVGMLVVWGIMFTYMGYRLKIACIRLNDVSKSASDYSVIVEKMPTGMKIQEVQREFNRYFEDLDSQEKHSFQNGFVIKKYNEGTPFYLKQDYLKDKQLNQILTKSQQIKNKIMELIKERQIYTEFQSSLEDRNKKYDQFQLAQTNKQTKYNQMIQQIKNQFKEQNKQTTTTAFITFQDNFQKDFFLQNNGINLLARIKLFFCRCITNKTTGLSIMKDGKLFSDLNVYPACEPEDVVWGNVGVSFEDIYKRKLLTYTVSLALLVGSFFAVYGLSKAQNNSINRYVSILISIVITIVNLILEKAIKYLTKFQRDYTVIGFQASIFTKSIVVQLLNTILITIIANYYIKDKNIYHQSGLIEDVFILSCTLNIAPPVFKIVDLGYLYRKFCGYIKPYNRLQLNQFQLNAVCQRMEFQVGYQYIYVVSSFMFTCFFVSLQPAIVLINIGGLVLFYWAQKYSLFSRCQRPVPGSHIIDVAVYEVLEFGGVLYALGSLTWSNFMKDNSNSNIFEGSLAANIVAIVIGAFIFLFPFDFIYRRKLRDYEEIALTKYEDNRIFFPSEYDRLNPSTSAAGIEDYRKFVNRKRKEIILLSFEQKQNLAKLLLRHGQKRNFQKHSHMNYQPFSNDESNKVWVNLVENQSRNVVNPAKIAIALMPQVGIKQNVMLLPTAIQNIQMPRLSNVQEPCQSAQILTNGFGNNLMCLWAAQPPNLSHNFRRRPRPIDPFQQIFNPYGTNVVISNNEQILNRPHQLQNPNQNQANQYQQHHHPQQLLHNRQNNLQQLQSPQHLRPSQNL